MREKDEGRRDTLKGELGKVRPPGDAVLGIKGQLLMYSCKKSQGRIPKVFWILLKVVMMMKLEWLISIWKEM